MAEQNLQEVYINQDTSNDNVEDQKITLENENSEENLSKENKNPVENNCNKKVTVEDENPEETRLKESDKNENDSNPNNNATSETVDIAIPKKKRKKKKKKKSGADDADLDFHDSGPKEGDEDLLYDPSKPLTFRIEMAVQRFKKNRKFTVTRNQVFSSYLRFGGINTGQKSFLGQDGLDNADADAEEILVRRATDFIDDEMEDLEVDFTYIVRVYLSSYLIDKSGYVQMEQFFEGPQVVTSFLNYLLNHKVCPEYEDDIRGALEFAHIAKEELPKCKSLAQNAPGKFNKACSLLFGGELYGMLDDPWNGEETVAKMIGISKKEGERLIKEVFCINSIEELTRVKEESRTALVCEIIGVEPLQINTSEVSTNEAHQGTNREDSVSHSNNNTQEASINVNEENSVDGNKQEDSASHPNNKQETSVGNSVNGSTQEANTNENSSTQKIKLMKIVLREYDVPTAEPFYISVSSDVGSHAMPKMRITADFHKLSNGFWYWDKVTNVYPSYYLVCEDDSDDD